MVAQAYNPSYLGGRDQEDHGLKPARARKKKKVRKIPLKAGHGGRYLSSQL
jgi:hypothetical protein